MSKGRYSLTLLSLSSLICHLSLTDSDQKLKPTKFRSQIYSARSSIRSSTPLSTEPNTMATFLKAIKRSLRAMLSARSLQWTSARVACKLPNLSFSTLWLRIGLGICWVWLLCLIWYFSMGCFFSFWNGGGSLLFGGFVDDGFGIEKSCVLMKFLGVGLWTVCVVWVLCISCLCEQFFVGMNSNLGSFLLGCCLCLNLLGVL